MRLADPERKVVEDPHKLVEDPEKLVNLASKASWKLVQTIKTGTTWAVQFFSAGSPGEVLVPYFTFLQLSVIEITIWACIALLAQWSEQFLNGLVLAPFSKTVLWFGHELFIVRAVIQLQLKLSDGIVGVTLRELGRIFRALLRR